MNNWVLLVLGLIIGWLLYQLADYFFWRNRRVCTDKEIELQKSVDRLQGQTVALNQQVDTLNLQASKVPDLEASIQARDARIHALIGDVDARDAKLTTLESSIKTKDAKIGRFSSQIAHLESTHTSLNEQVKDRDAKLAGFTGRLGGLESDLSARDKQLSDLQAKLRTRNTQVSDFNIQLKGRDAQITDLRAQLSQRDSEAARLRKQLGSVDSELKGWGFGALAAGGMMALRDRFRGLNADLEEKEAAIGDLQLSAEGGNIQLNALSADLEARNREIDNLKADLEARGADIVGLNARIAELEGIATERDGQYSAEINGLRADLNARNGRIDSLQANLNARDGQIDGLQADLDVRNGQIDTLQTDLNARNAQIDGLRVDLDARNGRIDGLQADLNARDAQINGFHADLDARDAQIKGLRGQLADVDTELSGLNMEAGAAGAGLGLAGLVAWLRSRTSTLESNVTERDNQILALSTQAETTAADAANYSRRAADLEAQLAERDATILALQAAAVEPDDLTDVWGIGPKIAGALNAGGITTFAQLAALEDDEITEMLDASGVNYRLAGPNVRATWQEQAELLAAGDLDELKLRQAQFKRTGGGGLGKVWGIGSKVSGLLSEAGVTDYAQLATSATSDIDDALSAAESYYPNMSKSEIHQSWVEQASMAANGQWSLLKGYKNRFRRGRRREDLKRIWGIGPQVEKALNAKGIDTFIELAEASIEEIDTILSESGSHFNMATDTLFVNWRRQARLAAIGDWEDFQKLHDQLTWESVQDND